MTFQLAMYKGPPKKFLHKLTHALTKWWFKSSYSHSEVVIDGVCWTSSYRDKGVRFKHIDLASGNWDVFDIDPTQHDKDYALFIFRINEGKGYDQSGVLSYLFRFIKQNDDKWFCFEICAAALDYKGRRDRITPQELINHVS